MANPGDSRQDEEINPNYEVDGVTRRRAFRAMLAYAKPQRMVFLGVFFCAILAIAADLFQPYLVKIVIDDNMLGDQGAGRVIGLGLVYSCWQLSA